MPLPESTHNAMTEKHTKEGTHAAEGVPEKRVVERERDKEGAAKGKGGARPNRMRTHWRALRMRQFMCQVTGIRGRGDAKGERELLIWTF